LSPFSSEYHDHISIPGKISSIRILLELIKKTRNYNTGKDKIKQNWIFLGKTL
jgi:hypothetical protein